MTANRIANSHQSSDSPAASSTDRAMSWTLRMTLSMRGVWFFPSAAAIVWWILCAKKAAMALLLVRLESRSDTMVPTFRSLTPSYHLDFLANMIMCAVMRFTSSS